MPVIFREMSSLTRAAAILAGGLFALAGPAQGASALDRDDGIVRTTIQGIDEFHAVVELLRAELFSRGFRQQDVTDIDLMLRSEGTMLHNKLVSAFDPERFADAIVAQPVTALLAGARILVYQEKPEEPLSYRAQPGDIVIAAMLPFELAELLGIEDRAPIEAMTDDLEAALEATHAFFEGPESGAVVESPAEVAAESPEAKDSEAMD